MTTSTHTSTVSQVLRVEIELAPRPALTGFAHQVENLAVLARFSTRLAAAYSRDEPQTMPGEFPPLPPPSFARRGIYVVRSSIASPWVTILAEATNKSAPVWYSVTALYCLQKLLKMLMEWQTHRANLRDRELEKTLSLLNIGELDSDRQSRPLDPPIEVLGMVKAELAAEAKSAGTPSARHSAEIDSPDALSGVADAAGNLGKLLDVEMMDEDNPRVGR